MIFIARVVLFLVRSNGLITCVLLVASANRNRNQFLGVPSAGYAKSVAETAVTGVTGMSSVTKVLGKPDEDGKWDKIIK